MVQPLASRIILPNLGGAPAVWTTSMLFFQILLLSGYLWAHIMIRYMPAILPPILQPLITAVALLSINYNLSLDFDYATTNPMWWQLKTLAYMVGLPYFALATNAPLYQAIYKEFRNSRQGKTPYALYAFSNIGSFLALVAYLFVLEPALPLGKQIAVWQWGYTVLCVVVALSGMVSLARNYKNSSATKRRPITRTPTPSFRTMATWCLFAFIPSSLMLGVTAHVTTDIASIPLLWVIPLAFYLLSFVISFSEPPLWIARHEKILHLCTFSLLAFAMCFIAAITAKYMWIQIALHYTAFLFSSTLCHLKLARIKPHTDHLTIFYIVISIGGCLGGIFNALIAYKIFAVPVEYFLTVILMIAAFARYKSPFDKKDISATDIALLIPVTTMFAALVITHTTEMILPALIFTAIVMLCYWNRKMVLLCMASALCLIYTYNSSSHNGRLVHLSRNIFGTLMIIDNPNKAYRTLVHGTTLHGIQTLPLMDYPHPTTYYNRTGPLGDVFRIFDNRPGEQNIAALGMGIGTIACYIKQDRHFHFYEINQSVINIAKNPEYFTYLSSCAPDATIVLGDARIGLTRQQDNQYDIILVDAFSSDSIPVHLITNEALRLYADKLKQNGIIAFHVSNRYFDLVPIVASMAKAQGLAYAFRYDREENNIDNNEADHPFMRSGSIYIVVAKSQGILSSLMEIPGLWYRYKDDMKLPSIWTDDYVNIFSALKF